MFENPAYADHECVLQVADPDSGLRAILAIHSTALGPAGGGCRLWRYDDPADALTDALRLSQGMSYKCALAELPMGGGKAVILGPLPAASREAAFRAFGRAVDTLGGRYVTAEDVGVSVEDIEVVASQTRYVSGLRARAGRAGGDPAPYTARGVCLGLEVAVEHALGRRELTGLRIAVQGLGSVGARLCLELARRGARLLVADLDARRVEAICDEYDAEPGDPKDLLFADVDVVAPCALGGVLTEEVARRLRARVVAGAANNQLANATVGRQLHERGITYAPDYVINAGGIIMVAGEYSGQDDPQRIEAAIERIAERTREILERARRDDRASASVADALARERIDRARVA